ncbi:MAG: CarD family transcriptional regulator [Andreesenia angusta]|nr:CarD family transcriptional regulator [Andreesenia angusta]
MFEIGDKIVYPMHGAGTIVSIEREEVLGKKKEYYIMIMPIGEMRVMVPVDMAREVGVREVSDNERIDEVLEILSGSVDEMSSNWNRRYRNNLDKIKGGDICELAVVIKNLVSMENEKGLSTGERKMLNNAMQILLSEVALVKEIKEEEAQKIIQERL